MQCNRKGKTMNNGHRPGKIKHRYAPLGEQGVKKVHESTLHVLEEVGFEVHNDEAFDLFSKAACAVDSERRVVKLRPETVMELVSAAPREVTLCGRSEKHDLELGRGNVYFGTGGTALNVMDYGSKEHRRATLQDLIEIIRICDHLSNIDLMLLPTYPAELPIDVVDVNRFFAGFMHTTKHIMGGIYTAQGMRDVIAMAETIAGSREALRRRPFLSMIACGISPLRIDEKYSSFMIDIARERIPVAVPAEPLCGATSPISLGGNLVMQNCDGLINVMLTQLASPGAPVIYGCVASATNLRDLTYLGGPVESGLVNAAAAEMAQYYGIPSYTTAGISDSKTLDAQCGYESAINNLLVGLAGSDFIHDAAGLMEFAMTVSKEKLVIDNEIVGMAKRAIEGVSLDSERLGLDEIKRAGPGGNFTASRHTRKFMHREHYRPQLSDREKRSVWREDGAQSASERAHEVVERLLAESVKCYVDLADREDVLERFPVEERAYEAEVLYV